MHLAMPPVPPNDVTVGISKHVKQVVTHKRQLPLPMHFCPTHPHQY